MPRTATSTVTQLLCSDRREHVKCCFTSTETVGLLRIGAQDGHLDFHTAPELRYMSARSPPEAHTQMGPQNSEDVPLVEFVYLVFTRMPGEGYSRRLRSLLLYLCYVFRALINSLVC